MGTTLYVRNLDESVDSSELEDMFTTVGNVKSASVESNQKPGARVGYVQMASEQEAQDGIDRFNGHLQNGFPLVVTKDVPHQPDLSIKPIKRKK